MRLREQARKYPNVKIIEGNVTSLQFDDKKVIGVEYTSQDTKMSVTAPLTVISDGCFSKFYDYTTSQSKTISSRFAGVLLQNMKLPYEGSGHVMLIKPTPMLFYRISSNDVRALIDIGDPEILDIKQFIISNVIPQLPDDLATELSKAIEVADNIKVMPNFKLHPAPLLREGVITLGDALNIRHPLTGGGMTVAFSDISRILPLLSQIPDFGNTKDVVNAYNYFFVLRKPLASTINILAQSLYRIFGQSSTDPEVSDAIRNACFSYFQLGGDCVNGPMSLISGVVESPMTLLYHYSRVGFYGFYLFIFKPIIAFKLLNSASQIFVPLLISEMGAKPTFAKN